MTAQVLALDSWVPAVRYYWLSAGYQVLLVKCQLFSPWLLLYTLWLLTSGQILLGRCLVGKLGQSGLVRFSWLDLVYSSIILAV